MTKLTKAQVMEKLEKLLRLSGGKGATEAEMKLAMEKATALAREHNIDLSTVNPDGSVNVSGIETDKAQSQVKTKSEPAWVLPIVHCLQDVFGVKAVLHQWRPFGDLLHIRSVTWVGEKTDVAMVSYLWTWLSLVFPQCWAEYRKQTGMKDGHVNRRSYYNGLSAGIVAANRRAREFMPRDEANRYSIVLKTKAEIVEAKFREDYPEIGQMNNFQRKVNPWAEAAGFKKGQTIKLGQEGLSATSARQIG